MKITFNINYHTNCGESLHICGGIPELGGNDPHKAVEMNLQSPDQWQLSLELDKEPDDFEYSIIVKAPDPPWRLEWGTPHRYASGRGIELCTIFDSWSEIPADKPFYSSAFT